MATIKVTVQNTDTVDLFVTLIDNNAMPPGDVMPTPRVNAGDSVQNVSLQADGNNDGNVTWTATNVDQSKTKTKTESTTNLATVGVDLFGV